MDRPVEGAEVVTGRLYLAADGATGRPADGMEEGAEVVTGRHYLEADGAMDRPADGAEVVIGRHRLEADGAEVVIGRHRLEADGADGSVQAVPKAGRPWRACGVAGALLAWVQ
jgi:hypothetical protein